MKSGNRNFLEPSGPLQACNGTALPLPIVKILQFALFGTSNAACMTWYQYFSLHDMVPVLQLE
jgi:hypothetical protein